MKARKKGAAYETYIYIGKRGRNPAVGFGTYKAADDNDEAIISEAIRQGYRHLDTAAFYFNEEAVGKAVRKAAFHGKNFS